MAVLKYKNKDTGKWETIPHVIQGGVSEDTISYTKEQNLTDEQKETARTNIGAISQTELDDAVANIGGGNEIWQTIADITLDEAVKEIIVTQDTEGQAFSLTKAKVIVDTYNQDGFYTATANISLGILSAETGGHSRSIYLTTLSNLKITKNSSSFFKVVLMHAVLCPASEI